MANLNYNKVIIGGRITAKPELKTTQSGLNVTTFTIAVNRRKKEDGADFFNITAWNQIAANICKFLDKGSCVLVTGEIHNRSYKDKNGENRHTTEILATNVDFVDSKADNKPTASNSQAIVTQQPYYSLEDCDGEELPF